MKSFAICAVLVSLLAGCQTNPADMNNSWKTSTITERVTYHAFTGYQSLNDGVEAEGWFDVTALGKGVWNHTWSDLKHMTKTFSRHFLAYNPDNPQEAFLR